MSHFQKNFLLTLILLAAIAYPPLYYSIRNTIQKESLPKNYNAPDLLPHMALGDWKLGAYKDEAVLAKAIRNIVQLQFAEMSGSVFYGEESSLRQTQKDNLHIVLLGDFSLNKESLQFKPRLYFPKTKKFYNGDSISVPWAEVGTFPNRITLSYRHLISETIRLHRILLNLPRLVEADLDSDILSSDEFLSYVSLFSQDKPNEEKSQITKNLILTSPKASFVFYERMKQSFANKGVGSYKELWKEWEDNKNPTHPLHTSRFAYSIGKALFFTDEWEKSWDYLQLARKKRENTNQVFHFEYANTLSLLGQVLIRQGKKEDAVYYLTSAREMYSSLGLSADEDALRNLWYHSLLLAGLGQKEVALGEFYQLESYFSGKNDFESALFYFDFAKLEYDLKAYSESSDFLQKSRSLLFEKQLTNHELNFLILQLQAAVLYKQGKVNEAKLLWEEITASRLLLPSEDKIFYRESLYGLALIYQQKGANAESEGSYRNYTRLTPYSQIQTLSNDPLVPDYIYPGILSSPDLSLFTGMEESVIRSYTGRYIFSGQEEEIRARTYENRLEDTNEFLRDLLEKDFFGTPALASLKEDIFPGKHSYEKGENVVFLDIGPALNNPDAPGITSQSVAFHFPKMDVVLWELPKEVDLFLKKVPMDKKEQLYSFGNIRILAADGVGSFKTEYYEPKNWILSNRSIPSIKNKTVIMRAANSIDIYETFAKIQPHFQDIATELKDNPVLYFFNRSILLKPKGQSKFTLIGYQSIRGFHHNFQSLDRNGEPPYTLAKYTLSDK
ncbi:tetratricopeptide repeat protein [Leptospira sp. 'Mane']|uniref:tetratricopeptide repeat protein n=1 Tax=Leptospira sp. 'Mane' TaxID=3387407 RepID=UPI00398B3C6E